MTDERAAEILANIVPAYYHFGTETIFEACRLAVKALKKQMQEKRRDCCSVLTTDDINNIHNYLYICPECHNQIPWVCYAKYCPHCGQQITPYDGSL